MMRVRLSSEARTRLESEERETRIDIRYVDGFHTLARELCLALGLVPERTRSIDIHLDADSVMTIKSEQVVIEREAEELVDTLRRNLIIVEVRDR